MAQQQRQIAIITDDPTRVEAINTIISNQGFVLLACIRQPQPLIWLLSQSTDIVLIDLDMENSLELINQSVLALPRVPVVALAAPERLVMLQPVLLAGVKDFIAIPINAQHFMTVVDRTIRSQQMQNDSARRTSSFLEDGNGQQPVSQSVNAVDEGVLIEMPPKDLFPADSFPPEIYQNHRVQPNHDLNGNDLNGNDLNGNDLNGNGLNGNGLNGNGLNGNGLNGNGLNGNGLNGNDLNGNGSQTYGLNGSLPQVAPEQPENFQNNHYPVGFPKSSGMNHNPYLNGYDTMQPPPRPRRRLIAVAGLRGGVGRSTIATNLAIALQQRDLGNVILAEAHHGLSHLSLMLHLHPRNTIAGLTDDVAVDADIVNGHLQPHSSGIKILAAPAHLDDLVELSGERWADILEIASEISPIVVVDTAAIADAALLEVLVQADEIVVVMTPDIASLRSATALTKTLYEEGDVQGRVHVLLNRSNIGGGLDEGTIRKQLGHDLAITLPDDTSLATYAMNRGVPFVNSHPKALISKRINTLADLLFVGVPTGDGQKEPSKGLLPFMNMLRSS